ncbi:MAG TPA: hypothetical protein VGV17_03095 [Bosea sp. (in: a-proteobacteria)]|jgi:hypothetical protein|uniref:hypothetical protein n=1 Tax=Bosea sp. (in: a-proteobacteria) TaxID=1871050 RepID=UPI002DDCC56F|nr:hypothetical protein [Bosea sp. (in: a-proteobacteria)]HEV2552732.1 hypothetical protein [Bosea sp. (in: a-proteobacteria)]
MKRDDGLAIALFLLIIGGAIAFAIASDLAEPACAAAKAQISAAKEFDFGCIEFWFNRYQTTLATVASVAIALVVIRPAVKQLAEMKKQSSSEARQILRENIIDMASEVRACEALRNSMYGLDAVGYRFAYPEEFEHRPGGNVAAIEELVTSTNDALEQLQRFVGADPSDPALEKMRVHIAASAKEATYAARHLAGGGASLAYLGRSKGDSYNALGDNAHAAAGLADEIIKRRKLGIGEAQARLRELEAVIFDHT